MRLTCSLGVTARGMVCLFGACAREGDLRKISDVSSQYIAHSFPCLYFIFPLVTCLGLISIIAISRKYIYYFSVVMWWSEREANPCITVLFFPPSTQG